MRVSWGYSQDEVLHNFGEELHHSHIWLPESYNCQFFDFKIIEPEIVGFK